MKGNKIGTLFLIIFIIASAGCSKRIIPGIKNENGKRLDDAAFNYVYGEALRQKIMGNSGEALKFLEQCISMDPGSDAAYFEMARIVLDRGDNLNGKKYLRKAINIQPGNIWYHIMLGGIYYQEKNLDSTIICYENALAINPEKEQLEITLSNLFTEDGKLDKAREILEKFDRKYGANENTTITLVKNLIIDKKYSEARQKLKELLEEKPDEILYNGLLASIYQKEGDRDKAIEIYNKLIERNPDNPGIQLSLCEFLLSGKEYDDLFLMLNTLILNGNVPKDDKIALFSNMIEDTTIVKEYSSNLKMALLIMEATYKDDDIVVLLRPELLSKENKQVEAASILEEIIKINGDNYPAWEKLLMTYYDLRDFRKLQDRGEECATKFNRSVLAKILYAHGAMENKNYNISLEELRKAEILAGDNTAIKLQILTMRADIYYRMKNFEEAFKTFDDALKLNNNDLTVLNNYAYYLAEQNSRLKEAEIMSKQVIEKEKENTTFLDTYAWVLYKRGKIKEAARIMERIVNSGEKDDAEWYEHYGYILKAMGKCREAVEKWSKAVSIDSSKGDLLKEIEKCKK